MQITTKNIIKAIGFEEKFKSDLLENFDTLDPDQKYAITQLVWDMYQSIFNMKVNENMDRALEKVAENKEKFDDLYNRVRQETLREMEKDLETNLTSVDLTAARAAMEKIIREIHASKKDS